MIPLAAAGVTDVPEEHEAGCTEMEAVQGPDRSERQAEHVHRIFRLPMFANTMFPRLYEARSLVRLALRSIGRVLTTKIAVDTDPASSGRLALTFPPLPAGFLFSNSLY
jgi:hypothetical protein